MPTPNTRWPCGRNARALTSGRSTVSTVLLLQAFDTADRRAAVAVDGVAVVTLFRRVDHSVTARALGMTDATAVTGAGLTGVVVIERLRERRGRRGRERVRADRRYHERTDQRVGLRDRRRDRVRRSRRDVELGRDQLV